MTATRTAWQITRYGGPDRLKPVKLPVPEPGQNEILIRIHASAVTRADGMMRAGKPLWARPFLGLRRPRAGLSGTGFSGTILALGPGASRFRVGDEVFGEAGMTFGANASHIALDESGTIMPKPKTLSHEEAATMTDGPLTSLNFLENLAELRAGEKVLILAGSGSLGSAAIQIASAMGADVTATTSPRNAGLVASLGATRIIDYTSEDFTKTPDRWDVIFDTIGTSSYGQAARALTRTGRYVNPVLTLGLLTAMARTSLFGSRKARFSATGLLKPDTLRSMLDHLLDLHAGDNLTPVMDRTYGLNDLPEAHRYVETGRKRGNVVVTG